MKPAIFVLLVSTLVLLAAVARYQGLSEGSLTSAEATAWKRASLPTRDDTIRSAASAAQPPLYYLALGRWMGVFGDGASALRGLSALCGVATVGVVSFIAMAIARAGGEAPKLGDARAPAVFAAALMATAGTHIRLSREAQPASLAWLLGSLSTLLLVEALYGKPRGRPAGLALWAGYAATMVAGLYTDRSLWVMTGCQLLWLLGLGARGEPAPSGPRRGLALAIVLVSVAALVPWWHATGQSRAGDGPTYLPGRTRAVDIAQWWAGLILPWAPAEWGDGAIAYAPLVLSIAAVLWYGRSARRAGTLLINQAVWPAFILIAASLYGYPLSPLTAASSPVPVLIPLILIVSFVIARWPSARLASMAVAVLAVNQLLADHRVSARYPSGLMTGARGAVLQIQRHRRVGEPIVVRYPPLYLRMVHGFRDDREALGMLRLLPRTEVQADGAAALVGAGEVCRREDLERWRGSRIWAVDGATNRELLVKATLPDPWVPSRASTTFPEPGAKVVLTESRCRGELARP